MIKEEELYTFKNKEEYELEESDNEEIERINNNYKFIINPNDKKFFDNYKDFRKYYLSNPEPFIEKNEDIVIIKKNRKKSLINKDITNELIHYDFDSEIKESANKIYKSMNYKIRRDKKRLALIQYCIFCAYLELNRFIDTNELQNKFGNKKPKINKIFGYFKPVYTGYQPKYSYVSPLNYIKIFCNNLNFSDELINDIMNFSNRIIKKLEVQINIIPKTLSTGIIKYYIITNGININNNKIREITYKSNATIEKIYKLIARIDNE